jgi:hypothetical protein
VRAAVLAAPTHVADAKALVKSMRDLRSCWLAARHKGSIFELVIGELVEELLVVHDERKAELSRTNDDWDAAYLAGVQTGTFAARNARYRLMAPRKRRILTKLLALRIVQQQAPLAESDLIEAMTDEGLRVALRQVSLMERSTRELLEIGAALQKRRGDGGERFSLASDHAGEVRVTSAATGSIVPTSEELQHMDKTEDALFRWERIIEVVENYLVEQPFTRHMFSLNRTEQWYGFRDLLVAQLASYRHAFGDAPGWDDEREESEDDDDEANSEEAALISKALR